MCSAVFLFGFLLSTATAKDDISSRLKKLSDMVRALNEEVKSDRYSERLRSIIDCKQLGGSCKGVVPCCGTLQCYWPNGYSMITDGTCVECVQREQKCQRDAQCCSPYVCQKGKRLDINGSCDYRRPNGGECHENDQCQSSYCEMSLGASIKGYGGVCKPASGWSYLYDVI